MAIAIVTGSVGLFGSMAAQCQPQARIQGATGAQSLTVNEAGIEMPLVPGGGDAQRGRRIVADPLRGNCLICHTVPDAPQERFQGDIGPPLAGVGARLSAAQLRLRLVDSTRINPTSVMPAYHRTHDLSRVAPRWRNKPVLSAADVEDVIAYLQNLDTSR